MCVVLERVLLSFCYTRCPLFPARLIEEAVFFPQCNLTSFVKDKLPKGSWVYLWYFYLVLLVYISVFVPIPYSLDDCGFVVEPEVRQVDSFSSILLSQDFLAIQGFLYFHKNCEIIYSSSVKNTIGSLIGIALNLFLKKKKHTDG